MPFGLPAALSWILLAFTIEFDNEFEHRVSHRTADRSGTGGVWLTSMAMWSNFVRLVPPDGVPLSAVEPCARITNLAGLRRWGFVDVSAGTVRLKPGGRRARQVWAPLAAEIEARWRDRLGGEKVDELRGRWRRSPTRPCRGTCRWSATRRDAIGPRPGRRCVRSGRGRGA